MYIRDDSCSGNGNKEDNSSNSNKEATRKGNLNSIDVMSVGQ
jgi:hypothetical protein